MEVYISQKQAREIRRLLHGLDQSVPADLTKLGFVDAYDYIAHLRRRYLK